MPFETPLVKVKLLFTEKEQVRFLAEGLRNIATGLIIAGFAALATTPYIIAAGAIAIGGCITFAAAYFLIRN